MIVTFCGHSQVADEDAVRTWLKETVVQLICQGADLFYLGGYGEFDRLAARVVWDCKRQSPEIESILVLPYLDSRVDTSIYDGTTYPPLESVPRRYAISHRNRWTAENSSVIVAYINHSWGGAATTLKHAQRKKKTIIQFPQSIESWKEQ